MKSRRFLSKQSSELFSLVGIDALREAAADFARNESSTLQNLESLPLEDSNLRNAPTESFSAPIEFSSAPVEFSSAPVEFSSAPVEFSSAPVEFSSAPVDSSSAPVVSLPIPTKRLDPDSEVCSEEFQNRQHHHLTQTQQVAMLLTVDKYHHSQKNDATTGASPTIVKFDASSATSENARNATVCVSPRKRFGTMCMSGAGGMHSAIPETHSASAPATPSVTVSRRPVESNPYRDIIKTSPRLFPSGVPKERHGEPSGASTSTSPRQRFGTMVVASTPTENEVKELLKAKQPNHIISPAVQLAQPILPTPTNGVPIADQTTTREFEPSPKVAGATDTPRLPKGAPAVENEAIQMFEGPFGNKRRMSFKLNIVPTADLANDDDSYLRAALEHCGSDVHGEDEESDDDPLAADNDEEHPALHTRRPVTDNENLYEIVTLEISRANDEFDVLTHVEGDPFGARANHSPQSPERGASPPTSDAACFGEDGLRDWFTSVESSFRRGLKVVKVNHVGRKFVRTVVVSDDSVTIFSARLHADTPGALRSRTVSFSKVSDVLIGYSAKQFHRMIDTTPENHHIPPVQVCAAIAMPNKTVALLFPSEVARNEFVLLSRVRARKANVVFQESH